MFKIKILLLLIFFLVSIGLDGPSMTCAITWSPKFIDFETAFVDDKLEVLMTDFHIDIGLQLAEKSPQVLFHALYL